MTELAKRTQSTNPFAKSSVPDDNESVDNSLVSPQRSSRICRQTIIDGTKSFRSSSIPTKSFRSSFIPAVSSTSRRLTENYGMHRDTRFGEVLEIREFPIEVSSDEENWENDNVEEEDASQFDNILDLFRHWEQQDGGGMEEQLTDNELEYVDESDDSSDEEQCLDNNTATINTQPPEERDLFQREFSKAPLRISTKKKALIYHTSLLFYNRAVCLVQTGNSKRALKDIEHACGMVKQAGLRLPFDYVVFRGLLSGKGFDQSRKWGDFMWALEVVRNSERRREAEKRCRLINADGSFCKGIMRMKSATEQLERDLELYKLHLSSHSIEYHQKNNRGADAENAKSHLRIPISGTADAGGRTTLRVCGGPVGDGGNKGHLRASSVTEAQQGLSSSLATGTTSNIPSPRGGSIMEGKSSKDRTCRPSSKVNPGAFSSLHKHGGEGQEHEAVSAKKKLAEVVQLQKQSGVGPMGFDAEACSIQEMSFYCMHKATRDGGGISRYNKQLIQMPSASMVLFHHYLTACLNKDTGQSEDAIAIATKYLLRHQHFFGYKDKTALTKLAERCTTRSVKKGDVLLPVPYFYFVLAGAFNLLRFRPPIVYNPCAWTEKSDEASQNHSPVTTNQNRKLDRSARIIGKKLGHPQEEIGIERAIRLKKHVGVVFSPAVTSNQVTKNEALPAPLDFDLLPRMYSGDPNDSDEQESGPAVGFTSKGNEGSALPKKRGAHKGKITGAAMRYVDKNSFSIGNWMLDERFAAREVKSHKSLECFPGNTEFGDHWLVAAEDANVELLVVPIRAYGRCMRDLKSDNGIVKRETHASPTGNAEEHQYNETKASTGNVDASGSGDSDGKANETNEEAPMSVSVKESSKDLCAEESAEDARENCFSNANSHSGESVAPAPATSTTVFADTTSHLESPSNTGKHIGMIPYFHNTALFFSPSWDKPNVIWR